MILIICLIVIYFVFRPSLDAYRDNDGKYHMLLWYTPLKRRDERDFINIIGGE